ncbi:hypothetical protein MKEN_01446000 [Mycena kentingensis (nom. inval.)]|nr:hypothetical protein MKEN_01446000 [Mycena kentingensis (nom. inval.)]
MMGGNKLQRTPIRRRHRVHAQVTCTATTMSCIRCGFPSEAPQPLNITPPFAPFPAYLTSNAAPDDSETVQVRQAIAHARNAISSLDQQTDALLLVLKELATRREQCTSFIDAHERVLTPIRQLPPEIMGEIFLRAVEQEDAPWNPDTNISWRLTRVCIAWRTLALASPYLWRKINVVHTYTPYDVAPWEVLRNALNTQIERTSDVPLFVRFNTVELRTTQTTEGGV